VFESGPLRTPDGGVDLARIKAGLVDVLPRIPRYRQRLAWVPLEDQAVWVDDPHFDLDYHVRHAALPRPGSPEQLKQLSARIMSQQLDRNRPLWETWVVEGVEDGDRFALITKIHHCMIDGSSGVDLAHVLLSASPDVPPLTRRPVFQPRPAPTRSELFVDSLKRRVTAPVRLVRDLAAFADGAEDVREELSARLRALRDLLSIGGAADATPLNGRVGPHRRFDWFELPLDELRNVRKAWNCTINDVVLTIVTGAVREYLLHRAVDPRKLVFRIAAPVSVRSEEERGQMGNRVSSWTLVAPIQESDPKAQLDAIHAETQRLRETRHALGVETMMSIAARAPGVLLSLGAQAMSNPTNLLVTNVPGPQMPLYCCGARLLGIYPQVPLMPNHGIGIALMSYAGSVCWGFNSDPELIPDADVFVEQMQKACERVRAAAALEPKRPKRRKKPGNSKEPKKRKRAKTPKGASPGDR
jgi:WS/DGAT/MGAT family acyltransferase